MYKAFRKRPGSKCRFLLVIFCVIIFILGISGNPEMRLDQGIAQEKTLFGTVNHKSVDISNSEKEEIIRICGNMKVGWLPTIEFNNGPPYFQNEQRQYISLVFESQMFMHIFVLDDDSIIAYIKPWSNSSGKYMVKNPDVLRDITNLLIKP